MTDDRHLTKSRRNLGRVPSDEPLAVPGWSAMRLWGLLAAGLACWALIIWGLVTFLRG